MEELRKQLIQFVPSLQLWAQSFLKNPNGTKVNFKSLRNGLEVWRVSSRTADDVGQAGHDVQQVSMSKYGMIVALLFTVIGWWISKKTIGVHGLVSKEWWTFRWKSRSTIESLPSAHRYQIHPRGRKRRSSQEKTRRLPFEIKTGKPSEHGTPSHRAQVSPATNGRRD